VRTATQAAWKTPRFDGVSGSTAVTLTANRTAAAAPIPAPCSSSPSASSSTTQASHCSAQAASCAVVAASPSRGRRKTTSPERTRVSAARAAESQPETRCERDGRPERSSAGATSTMQSTAKGAIA
jgi:hypothetical protein